MILPRIDKPTPIFSYHLTTSSRDFLAQTIHFLTFFQLSHSLPTCSNSFSIICHPNLPIVDQPTISVIPFLILYSASVPSVSKSVSLTIDRLRHFECFNVIRQIDRRLREHKSPENVTAELTAHCSKLRDFRQNICLSLIQLNISNITIQLSEKRLPGVICETLGYTRPFTGGRLVTPGQCEKYVDLVRVGLSGNSESKSAHLPKPFQKKKGVLEKGADRKVLQLPTVCKSFNPEQRLACLMIGRLAYRSLQTQTDKNETSAEICKKFHNKHFIRLVEALPGRTKT
jgi:hypothetical protein